MTIRILHTSGHQGYTHDELDKMQKQLKRIASGHAEGITYEDLSDFSISFISDIKKAYVYKNQKAISKMSGVSEPNLSKMQTGSLKERALLKYLSQLIPCYLVSLHYDSENSEFNYNWRKEPISIDDKNDNLNSNTEAKALHFLCYRWKYDGLAISFLKIFLDGRTFYSIYEIPKSNSTSPQLLYQQRGSSQLVSDNLEITVRRDDNRFLTTILAYTGPSINSLSDIARQRSELPSSNKGIYVSSYITISQRGRPTVGNMVLRQMSNIEQAIDIYVNYHENQNIRKSSHISNVILKSNEIDALNDDFSDQICTFLHNRRLGTDQFNLPRIEEPIPYMSLVKNSIKKYAGIYLVSYLSIDRKIDKRTICQLFPSGQARIIEQGDDKITTIEGFFRYYSNKILVGQFDYIDQSDFFRLTIILKSGKTAINNRYTFEGNYTYIGNSENSNGKLTLSQKSTDYLEVLNFINDIDLEDYLVDKLPIREEIQENTKVYGNIDRFEGFYECYALSSSSVGKAIEMFPIKIEASGRVQLKSRNSVYFGQASLTNGFLSIMITHKKEGLCAWRHLLFRVGDFTGDNFRFAVGAGTRNNQHHQARYGIELLFPSKLSFVDKHFGFMDFIDIFFSDPLIPTKKYKINEYEFSLQELEEFYINHKVIFQAVKMFFTNEGTNTTKAVDEKTIDLLSRALQIFNNIKDARLSGPTIVG